MPQRQRATKLKAALLQFLLLLLLLFQAVVADSKLTILLYENCEM